MADRDRERVCLVRRRGLVGEREEHSDHPRDLSLVRPPVTADRLLHPGRRVLGARDARGRGRDERGAPCLPDEERDAGVGTDEGLLQCDGVRLVVGDEHADALEDPLEPQLGSLARAGRPAPLGEGPDTPVAFVDDPVPARSRPWIDAEDLHARRVRSLSDDSDVGESHDSPTSPSFSVAHRQGGPGLPGGKAALRPYTAGQVRGLVYARRVDVVDLLSLEGRGPAWGTASEELNATLLVWREGEGQPQHVNEERDVAIVALAGAGTLVVDGGEHRLSGGMLAIVPRGAMRSLVAGPEGLRCLSLHRRRGGLQIESRAGAEALR